MIPALRDAAGDSALKGAPLTVYLHLLYELDPEDYRPVKQAALALQLQLTERTVRDALNVLCARGYIRRGVRAGAGPGSARSYRLVWKRIPLVPLEP